MIIKFIIKFALPLAGIFCSLFILVLQYGFNTPYLDNAFLEVNFFEGFLNGYCLFINAILYSLHIGEFIDTPFYFFDHLNANPQYLKGFVCGLFTNIFIMIFSKALEYKNNRYL